MSFSEPEWSKAWTIIILCREPEPTSVQTLYDQVQKAESCAKMWAYARGSVNSYRTRGNEGYRNLNVSRCINPSLLDRTPLQGISEGSINLQRFQLEMRYSEEEDQYLISRFRLLKTTERPQITDVVSDHSEEDSE